MNKDDALDLIEEHLGSSVTEVLSDGLKDGANEDMEFDSQLLIDIGIAVKRWTLRVNKL